MLAANEREFQGEPPNQRSKKLDLFGRKVYSNVGLQLRIASQQALLGCYDYNVCKSMLKFGDILLEDARVEFSSLYDE